MWPTGATGPIAKGRFPPPGAGVMGGPGRLMAAGVCKAILFVSCHW
jgi:hypothetical protein